MVELFANSEDPDQMPHSAASDLGLHCLPITLLGVSQLQGVVGWCEGVVYLMSPGRSTDIGLQLGKACYPCSR